MVRLISFPKVILACHLHSKDAVVVQTLLLSLLRLVSKLHSFAKPWTTTRNNRIDIIVRNNFFRSTILFHAKHGHRHNDFLRMFCVISPRNTYSLFLNSRIHPSTLCVRQFCRIAMMPCMMNSCFKLAKTMKVIVEYCRMVSTLWRLATRLPHCGTCLYDDLHYSMAT